MTKYRTMLAVLLVAGAVTLLPSVAQAGGRFDTRDRGSRYIGGSHYRGGHHYGSSRSHFGFSIGFGSGSHWGPRYSHTSFSFGTYRPHSYYRSYRPVYVPAPVYCPPPAVVYRPAPVYVAPAPVVVMPRTYSAPCYTTPSTYYYSSGGYYYGR